MRNSAIVTAVSVLVGASLLSGLGCMQGQAPVVSDSQLGVTVAPLDLPLMTDACYGLSVFNTDVVEDMNATRLVWTQPNLCASDYGAAGGIRFTGICDAQAGGFDTEGAAFDPDHNNTVMLVLNELYTGGDWDGDGVALMPGRDYINPCPAVEEGQDNGCLLVAPCTANQDTKVLFNLTIMRDAQLGFFDTIVKFQDVFCAAKLDCVDDDNATLTYLHDPTATPPGDGPTAVLAFACLGGASDDNTTAPVFMYLDDLVITCSDGTDTRTATIDPAGGPGNLTAPALSQSGASDILFGAAVNIGEGAQGLQYWNVLLGLNLPGNADENCTLHTTGTVSETTLVANTTPNLTRYPFIDWTIDLMTDGARSCTRHPLNGADGAVQTRYTALAAPETFDHTLAFDVTCPCWDTATATAQVEQVLADSSEQLLVADHIVADGAEYDILQIQTDIGSLALVAGYAEGSIAEGLEGPGPFCVAVHYTQTDENLTLLQPISAAEQAACALDVIAISDSPCRSNNGGCTTVCVYDGPGASHCAECATSADCTGGEVCDPSTYSCVGCLSWQDCESEVCDTTTHECRDCGFDCATNGQVCDATLHQCVDCLSDTECPGQVCDTTAHQCVACLTDTQCPGQHCDPTAHECVACFDDTQCPGQLCNTSVHQCTDLAVGLSGAGSAGTSPVCTLTSGGDVRCIRQNSPVLAADAIAIGAGAYACAVLSTGAVSCWSNTLSPRAVNGLGGVATQVTVGLDHGCALLDTGAVKCWGSNARGQLGDGTNTSPAFFTAVQVSGLTSGVTAIDAGAYFTCAVHSGAAQCWGANDLNVVQLGQGNNSGIDSNVPVQVAGLTSGIVAIRAGDPGAMTSSTKGCALNSSGQVSCWGAFATTPPSWSPVPVSGLGVVTAFDVGATHGCAVESDGGVKCWGYNNSGNKLGGAGTGDGTYYSTAQSVVGLVAPATAVSTSFDHSCALLTTGRVQCWGAISGVSSSL